MVTGAGGSIGSELCEQLIQCNPTKIVLFERSEFALYDIDRQLKPGALANSITVVPVLGSVTDRAGIAAAINNHSVDVILHAAAYKHVSLVETNEVEAARNNVLGTKTVVDAAISSGVKRFILVSTDKVVRPTNVMGATKHMVELVVHGARNTSLPTVFSLVRFGNVLGSPGSVVPLFASRISAGGPVTITDPEVTRFFMTIPEAARLVLLAGAYADWNELFVLDMGEPVRIINLAKQMIELSGRTVRSDENPDGDIDIEIIGLRPGGKLFEEVLVHDNKLMSTPILRSCGQLRWDCQNRGSVLWS